MVLVKLDLVKFWALHKLGVGEPGHNCPSFSWIMTSSHSSSMADLEHSSQLCCISTQPSFSETFSSAPGSMHVCTFPSKDSTSESSSEEAETHLVFRVMNPDSDRDERGKRQDSQKTEEEEITDEHRLDEDNVVALPFLAEPPHTHSDIHDEDIAFSAPTRLSLVRKQSKTLSESDQVPVRLIPIYEPYGTNGFPAPFPAQRASDTVQRNRSSIQPLVHIPKKPFPPRYSTEQINKDSKKFTVLRRSLSSMDTGLTAQVSQDNHSTNSTSAASNQDVDLPIRTSTASARFENARYPSKYAKASYSLTNNPNAIKIYREMAEKTQDPLVQLAYAKYLLDIAELYDPGHRKRQILSNSKEKKSKQALDPNSSNFSASSSPISRPMSYLDHIRPSFDSHLTSALDEAPVAPSEDTDNRRKRKHLEEEGVRWIRKLAKQQVGEAAYLKATWMEKSLYGFKDDPAKTLKLYTIGAKAGIPEAMYALGVRCERDGKYGQAFENYRNAADHSFVNATFRLATVYLHGELHQRQKMTTGLVYLLKAAESATAECNEPPYLFGLVLTNEYPKADIPRELAQPYGGAPSAVAYFERAADLGNLAAQSRIASIYERGSYGTDINIAKAYGYFVLAAKRGDASAMLGLSRLYNRGQTGPEDNDVESRIARDVSGWFQMTTKNEDKAFMWCQRAALQEHVDALFLLGWYYEMGIGVPRDYHRKNENYQKAASQGHRGAIERLSKQNSVTKQQHQELNHSSRQAPRNNRSKKKPFRFCSLM